MVLQRSIVWSLQLVLIQLALETTADVARSLWACRVVFVFFKEKLLGGEGGGKIEIAVYKGGIHVSLYMNVNVCTMIVQNDGANIYNMQS